MGFALRVQLAVLLAQQSTATDYTPALVAAGVALLGIIVAAWTAHSRLRSQLGHDRELYDLGELRTVLDEAAGLTYSAIDKLTDAMVAAEQWGHAGQNAAKQMAAMEARREAF